MTAFLDYRVTLQDNVRIKPTPTPQAHACAHLANSSDLGVFTKFRSGLDDGTGVYAGDQGVPPSASAERISASATSEPSTYARPCILAARERTLSTFSSRRS